jgi:hypothetical protein
VKRLALLCALALAGCGGGAPTPTLPAELAREWTAAATGCRNPAGLRASVIAAINNHRVPDALQEPLTSKVNALASGACNPRRARELADWLAENS